MGHSANNRTPGYESLKREIAAQLKKTMLEIAGTTSASDESIHRIRRRSKRIRANLRLLRIVAPKKSRQVAAHVRDASAALAPFRDAQIIPAAVGHVRSAMQKRFDVSQWDAITRLLLDPTTKLAQPDHSLSDALIKAAQHSSQAYDLLSRVRPGSQAMTANALAPMYRKGRQSVARLLHEGHAESFHELRKITKAHRYQCRFMKPKSKRKLEMQIRLGKELGDLLGEAQDLAVLRRQCQMRANQHEVKLTRFTASCEQLTQQLHDEATNLACRIFFMTTRQFVASVSN